MIENLLHRLAPDTAELLSIPMKGQFHPRLDLSIQNVRETTPHIHRYEVMRDFVEGFMVSRGATVAWGGYLEQRLIYNDSNIFFQDGPPRNIHLGVDFYAAAGTEVFAPLAGTVHSWADNAARGDYGPTVILRHEVAGLVLHTLYGHLDRASLDGLEKGMPVAKGQRVGALGVAEVNGNWPPHLHFQLIRDMEGKEGDYPGVCAVEHLRHYQANCPDPRLLLGI